MVKKSGSSVDAEMRVRRIASHLNVDKNIVREFYMSNLMSIGTRVSKASKLVNAMNKAPKNLRIGRQDVNRVISNDFDPTLEYKSDTDSYRMTDHCKKTLDTLTIEHQVLVLTETNRNLMTSKPIEGSFEMGGARPRRYTPNTQELIEMLGANQTSENKFGFTRKGRERANTG